MPNLKSGMISEDEEMQIPENWKKDFHSNCKVILFYTVSYILFFAPALLAGMLLAPGDGTSYYLPAFYSSKALWTPMLFGGLPIGADPQMMTWYPVALLLRFFGNTWNAFILLAYILASSFTYGLVKNLTKSNLAGLIAGLIFGMSGFLVGHLGHTTIIHAAAWLPAILLGLEKLRQRFSYGWLVLTSGFVASSLLAGHPQIFVYSIGLAVSYVLVLGWWAPGGRLAYYLRSLLPVILGIGLAGIQIVPTAEFSLATSRASMSFQDFTSYSLPLKHLALFFYPYLFGGPYGSMFIYYFGAWNQTELAGYFGLSTLVFVIVAIGIKRKEPQVLFWSFAAGIALLLAFGDQTPLARLMYYIPGYNLFRVPARHLLELNLAVSVLAGFGIAALQQASRKIRHKWIYRALAVVSCIMLSIFLSAIFFENKLKITAAHLVGQDFSLLPWKNPAVAIPILLTGLIVIFILWWVNKPSTWKNYILLAIIVLDLGSFSWFYEWQYASPYKQELTLLANSEKYKQELNSTQQRLLPVRGASNLQEQIPPNQSRLWGIPSVSGYGPLMINRYFELTNISTSGNVFGTNWYSDKNLSLDLLATKYFFLPLGSSYSKVASTSNNIGWSAEDLKITLGSGLNTSTTKETEINLSPQWANGIGIVSTLGMSTLIPQGSEVLEVKIINTEGREEQHFLTAGKDVSELKLNSTKNVQKLKLKWVGPPGEINIFKISLNDSNTGQSWPLSSLSGALSDAKRWRHVENLSQTLVYQNLRAMPRAWMVPEVQTLQPAQILQAIQQSVLPAHSTFDPGKQALVEETLQFKVANPDPNPTVKIVKLADTKVDIVTTSKTPGFLVLSDVNYPGWKAKVDGQEVPVFQTNYVLRGVMVPAGEHIVKFEFQPRSFYIGATISGVTGLVLIVLLIRVDFLVPLGSAHSTRV
ncbi:MAG: YfhO family protein [Carboxydocellales bacterium]